MPLLLYTIPTTNNVTNTVSMSFCSSLTNIPPAGTHLLMTVDSTNQFIDIVSRTPAAALPLPMNTNTFGLKWKTYYNYGLYLITNETTSDVFKLYWANGP